MPDNPEMLIEKYGASKKVQLRNVLTGEEYLFDTLTRTAEFLNISLGCLSTRINMKNQPVFPGYFQMKWFENNEPWRQVTDPYLELSKTLELCKVVQVVNDKTKEMIIYESCMDCARAHNLLKTTLCWRLKTQGSVVYKDGFRYGYYPFKYEKDPTV